MKKGWNVEKLKMIVDRLTNGYVGPTKKIYHETGIPYLLARHVKNNMLKFDGKTYISNEFNIKNKKSILKTGDILLVQSGHIGHSAVVPKNHEGHNCHAMIVITPKLQFVNSEFLSLYFLSPLMKEQFEFMRKGSTIKHLNCKDVREINIPLPPLPEQKRIVAVLDESFAALAKAKENAEKNLENARELFETYLQGVFENGNWVDKRIQDITKVINGYAFSSKDFKPIYTVKSIKITNVGVKKFVEETDNYLPEKFKETLKDYQAKKGNIVIALTRTIISAGLKVAIVPKSYDGSLINQRVVALVPIEKFVNQNYLYYYLTTIGVAKYVLEHVNTLMQPNLSIIDLKNMPVPCPTIKDQENIVAKLDDLRNKTKKLEAIYLQKLSDLEELKKSLLQKAFNGEL